MESDNLACQNMFNKPGTFICILTEKAKNRWPHKMWCLQVTAEVGLNPLFALMHAQPSDAVNFKNNYYDR